MCQWVASPFYSFIHCYLIQSSAEESSEYFCHWTSHHTSCSVSLWFHGHTSFLVASGEDTLTMSPWDTDKGTVGQRQAGSLPSSFGCNNCYFITHPLNSITPQDDGQHSQGFPNLPLSQSTPQLHFHGASIDDDWLPIFSFCGICNALCRQTTCCWLVAGSNPIPCNNKHLICTRIWFHSLLLWFVVYWRGFSGQIKASKSKRKEKIFLARNRRPMDKVSD